MQLNTYNNAWFYPGANKLKCILWYVVNAIFFNSYFLPISGVKIFILRLFGCTIGKGVVIKPKVNIKYPWNIEIGNYTWIGENVWLDSLTSIKIGKNVCLSQGAFILTGNHNYKLATFDLIVKMVEIEDEVWIGAKSIICPGVICGKQSVLTLGSIATSNLEGNTIYSGSPAIKIKKRYTNS